MEKVINHNYYIGESVVIMFFSTAIKIIIIKQRIKLSRVYLKLDIKTDKVDLYLIYIIIYGSII